MDNTGKNTFSRYWLPVLGWVAVIFILSSIPSHKIPKFNILGIDKIGHIAEYFILGLLLIRALRHTYSINLAKLVILAIIIASFYGCFDEWYQSFIPGRTKDIYDFLADFIGLNIGIFLYKKGK